LKGSQHLAKLWARLRWLFYRLTVQY